jgi:hypothetical protein
LLRLPGAENAISSSLAVAHWSHFGAPFLEPGKFENKTRIYLTKPEYFATLSMPAEPVIE